MALNPQLYANGMPVLFIGEMFVLVRDGVEFEVDKIPGSGSGHVKTNGTIYLSNIRMVFVSKKPAGDFIAFDMPLLHIHGEKFNQPIFHCNNISGKVEPVIPEEQHRALYSTHSFKILFKEAPHVDPLQAAQTPVDEMMRCAYVDPNDPTRIFLQQPTAESQLRRRTYHQPAENAY